MTTDTHTFTHLESLLLFQSVAAYGNTTDSFARISNALKNSELLQRATGADNDRLNPQALTDLYLRLLKSEAKLALQSAEKPPNQNAKKSEAATPSRRSEIPSPKIATLEDADQHRHLEPQMIDRLYGLYKDQVIQEIAEEEQKYDQLVRQAKSLEVELKQVDGDDATGKDVDAGVSSSVSDVNNIQPELDTVDTHVTKEEDRIDSTDKDATTVGVVRSHRELDGETVAAVQPSQDQTPKAQLSPKRSKTPAQQRVVEPGKSPAPISLDIPTKQDASEPNNEIPSISVSPRRKLHRQAQGSSELSTPDASTDNEVQVTVQGPKDSATNHLHPQHAKQTPHSPAAQPPSSVATRSGGMQLPPFQVSPQAPHQSHQPQTAKQVLGQPLPRQVKSVQELQNESTPAGKATGGPLDTPHSLLKQVPSSRQPQVKPSPGTFTTPGSDTKWKVMPGMADVPLPRPRSISPLSDEPVSPVPSEKQTPFRHHKSTTSGPARETRRSKATRASSKTPSVALSTQGRTRSQSVASNADDGSLQSAPSTIRNPKRDVSTPTADTQPSTRQTRATRNSTAAPAPTAATTGKRKRASTLETDAAATPGSNSIPLSPTPGVPSTQRTPFDKEVASTITAPRNFHKTSAPMLINIGTHRHASLFSAPVSSRTAGYYDIIKRPTDLNSIRKAIAAGLKAVSSAAVSGAAASPSASTPVTSGAEVGGTVTLPISRELVPPEGIVNGAQLEQEVMRMFANAVMFNEGNDGVVADTREMFEDTEKTIAAWKAAELGEEAGVGGGDEGPIGTSAKRRRA